MKTTRWSCWLLWVGLFVRVSTFAEATESFQYSRPIEIPADTQEELFAVPLDSDVYAATRSGFPDVRVYDEADRLVPFLIRPISETKTCEVRHSWSAVNPTLRPFEENGMEIRLSLQKDDPSPDGLRFVTPLQNFEQQVDVYAIDGGAEQLLVDGAMIFDYSKFMDVRRTDVKLPVTMAREFRVVVGRLTSEQESQLLELTRSLKGDTEEGRTEKTKIERRPFRIDRIEFWQEQVREVAGTKLVQPWPISNFKVKQDAEEKQTIVEFSSRREPLTAVKILTSSRNFSRRAEIQIPDDASIGPKWRTIGEATVSQFQLQDFHEEHAAISLAETRHEQYRVIIKNGDSPELSITGVEVEGSRYQIVFLRPPGQTVRLLYGSESADSPQQDDVALRTALDKKISPAVATLGIQSTPLSAVENPIDVKRLMNNPFALGALVAVLVAALGWGLYQAGRRIDQMPHEDAE